MTQEKLAREEDGFRTGVFRMGHVTTGLSQRLITRTRNYNFFSRHPCFLPPARKTGCPPRISRASTRSKRPQVPSRTLTRGICSTSPPIPISMPSLTYGPTSHSSRTITSSVKVVPPARWKENLPAKKMKTTTMRPLLRKTTYFTPAMPTKTLSPASLSQPKTLPRSRDQGQGRSSIRLIWLLSLLPLV